MKKLAIVLASILVIYKKLYIKEKHLNQATKPNQMFKRKYLGNISPKLYTNLLKIARMWINGNKS
jgi:hypothetical protein